MFLKNIEKERVEFRLEVIFKRTHRVENSTKYRADDLFVSFEVCVNIFLDVL